MGDLLEAINKGQSVQALGEMINGQKRDLDSNLDKALQKTVTNVKMSADDRVLPGIAGMLLAAGSNPYIRDREGCIPTFPRLKMFDLLD